MIGVNDIWREGRRAVRTILISGASRGLGAALANAFSQCGNTVFAGARDVSAPSQIPLNVRSLESVGEAVRTVVGSDGGIDILVNNAGTHLAGPVASLDQDRFKETLDVNLLGAWRLTRAALPYMRPGGTIAMISSLSGLVGLPEDGAYAASKFALEGLSQSLAAEVAPLGIRVLIFEPGRIATGFAGTSGGADPAAVAEQIVSIIDDEDAPFRNPLCETGRFLFETVGIDRGARTEDLVRKVTGKDWRWQGRL